MPETLAPALYIVATPIGNLEDITLRALRVLRECDLIACEDTRHTQKLLNHFAIDKPTVSYHEHNEFKRANELIERVQRGERVALVSDAGTPGISDPGYRVIALAREHGIAVVPIPGASALVSALVASGLPTDSFLFAGFLPAKAGQRRSELERLSHEQRTVIFYEAPHRIVETLEDINATLGPERQVVLARELTKVHEEFLRGSVKDVLAQLREREAVKGEFVLLIAPAAEQAATSEKLDIAARVRQLMREQKMDEKAALKQLAKETGLGKSELYREYQRTK